jgi:putative ABC transport system permease protein
MKGERKSFPRWMSSFLRIVCPADLIEEIEGDLVQKFNLDVVTRGRKRATFKLIKNVLIFCRPGIILRNRVSIKWPYLSMIPGYLTIGRRQLLKSKTLSAINIAGLGIGMTAFFLIVSYVNFEISFDDFHSNKDRVYRVALERYKNGHLQEARAENFLGLGNVLKESFPEITFTRFYKTPANTGVLFQRNNRIYNELGGELNADSGFFKVFPSLLIRGDASTALNRRHYIVLSESMAKKIFGDTDPMGQTILKPNNDRELQECVVTGIMRDIPANSHFHANFVIPLEVNLTANGSEWQSDFLHTYVFLNSDADPNDLIAKLNHAFRTIEKDNRDVKGTVPFLQPLTSIHLSSHLKGELEVNGSKSFVFGASAIGIIILIIAWINYANLETARFVKRAREIGVRRIIGSAKIDLALQFLVEYVLILAMASIFASLVLVAIRPYFSSFTGVPLEALNWSQPGIWIGALLVLSGGSFLVGIYPAVFLIRFHPIIALKGNVGGGHRSSSVRRSLVVAQFTISFALIAFVLVIRDQIQFMQSADKRFDANQVIAIRNPTAYSTEEVFDKHNYYQRFVRELNQSAPVSLVTSSSAIPGTEIGFSYVNLLKRNVSDPYDPTIYKTLFIDYNYIPFYEVKLLAGKNFDPVITANWKTPWEDHNWHTIILNERAIHALGFKSPEDAVDQLVEFHNFGDTFEKHRIIGIVADYHHEAVKKEIFPMILSPNYGSFQQVYYSVRLNNGADLQKALVQVEKAWKQTFPEKPFDYFILNDYYNQQFKAEIHFGRIFTAFSLIAIFIACLGVLGMTMLEANTRLKEISIRKVLGASVANLVHLLSREHIRVISISSFIAGPVIHFLASEWLATYPVRISLAPFFFFVPFIVILAMVTLTSCYQTVKAANTNPVNHLKNE